MRKTFHAMLGIGVCLLLVSCGRQEEPLTEAGEVLINTIGMRFRRIQPGSFMMGSDKGERNEKDVHKVTLTRGFYIGVYEVTQEQWERVMGSNPSVGKGPNIPVCRVSWHDAQEFARRLSKKENVTYRLPTEAEWEYACRAGTTTEYYWGDKFDGRYAWNERNSGKRKHPVGLTRPNAWGLYDMSGNVAEWCEDKKFLGGYSEREKVDPKGPGIGYGRVVRGGDWANEPSYCRSAKRDAASPAGVYCNLGFRLVRTLSETRAGDLEDLPRTTSRPPGDELALTLPGEAEVKLAMRRIPAGAFFMGSRIEEGRRDNEVPPHEVTLSKPFYMGVYEVTQEQWEAVMGANPSHFDGKSMHPVESVSWDDIQAFLEKLNAMRLGTFRLPTEAEWEYACRADTTTSFYWGNDPDGGMIADYAWFNRNSRYTTHPVGQKKPNPWGLYDMSGNVDECCQDWHMESHSAENQTRPESESAHVRRGGCWHSRFTACRSTSRLPAQLSRGSLRVGLRLVREIE